MSFLDKLFGKHKDSGDDLADLHVNVDPNTPPPESNEGIDPMAGTTDPFSEGQGGFPPPGGQQPGGMQMGQDLSQQGYDVKDAGSPGDAPGTKPGSSGDMKREFELVNSKLDTIKAKMESIDHRLEKIERIASDEQQGKKKGMW